MGAGQPEDALREAVVNAACHRNYFEHGARIMVEIYDDRVDIVSPGGVCKGITPDNFGTVSITRNPLVQSMFYRIGYIEQMGTGIMRMRNATSEANVAQPEFVLDNFFKVTFKRSQIQSIVAGDAQAIPSGRKRSQAVASGRKRSRQLIENGESLNFLKNEVRLKLRILLMSPA